MKKPLKSGDPIVSNTESKYLFWLTTRDHHEDCFVVATSRKSACLFFEGSEGYCIGDSTAEFIERVPNGMPVEEGYAATGFLEKLGYRTVSIDQPLIFS